jgi:aryl-alcohol dehydrogenase-like predicted oxidoreductase
MMEYRRLGASGLTVPLLGFGAATFGGTGEFFSAWGATDTVAARRMLDLCLDAGVTLFDTADIYSNGNSETVLGEALKGRRDKALISTKATFRFASEPNAVGSSRYHLLKTCEDALRRLQTDYIDLFQLHGFDAMTPPEEILATLDQLVRAGKIRYVGVSNFSGWHLMKSLNVADRYGYPRYVANQTYYSLIGRDYEWELMPLGLDQGTGKIRRGQPLPETSRLHKTADKGPPVEDEYLFGVIDALDSVADETGKWIPQIALNWLFHRPTVSSVIIGARNEQQLKDNLGAVGWNLTAEQIKKLDAASAKAKPYPYWHQSGFSERNPPPV